MLQPSQVITENARQVERLKQQRREKQLDFRRQHEALLLEAKERIRREKSAVMEENIRIEIRNWIDTYFQQTGKIPDLPSAESGGSRMIFSRQVKAELEDRLADLNISPRVFLHTSLLSRREPRAP